MNILREKAILHGFIISILALGPALIWAQNSAVRWSLFSMGFAATSSPSTILRSHSTQIFIGQATGGDNRVISGFNAIRWGQGSTLALDHNSGLPLEYALRQNYPNPFNPSTTIEFDLPVISEVCLVVYDLLGHEVTRLIDGYQEPGYSQVSWHGKDSHGREVSAGIYVTRLLVRPKVGEKPEYVESIKMVLLK